MEYDANVLKELQDVELYILKCFAEICNKYEIDYFINYGTLIGAVRHKGFIPWDDDTDVGVLIDEYNKLKSVPPYEWDSRGLQFVTPEDDNDAYQFVYSRVYKINTRFKLESNMDVIQRKGSEHICDGIWLDIFTFHRVESEKEVLLIDKKAFKYTKCYRYSKVRKRLIKDKGFKRNLIDFSQNLFNTVVNIVYKKPEKVMLKKLNVIFGEEKGDYITTFDTPFPAIKSLVKYEDVFPLIELKFENVTVKAPRNYDSVLKSFYGNYMELPPIEKRKNHSPCILDFGDERGNVINNPLTR